MIPRLRTTQPLLVLALLLTSPVASEPLVEVTRLSNRVLVLNVPASQSTNVVALRSEAGIVVIDTEVSPTFAAAIRERIVEHFESDHFYCVVNTHGHGDHTSGNQVFNDVPIIAHENVGPSMVTGEARLRATANRLGEIVSTLELRLAEMDPASEQANTLRVRIDYFNAMRSGLGESFVLTPPTISFSDTTTLSLGDLTLELTWFGNAHSDSDILIFCPEENLLVTGDLFAPGADLYIDSQRIAQIPRWIDNLEEVSDRPEKPVAIVPGHGDFLPPTEIDRALEYAHTQLELYAGRESAFFAVKPLWDSHKIGAGLQILRDLGTHPETHYLIHSELDSYAFALMMDGETEDALQIFTVLAELFPDNDVAFDSLGEAYLRMDETERATASFRRATELNPDNRNAAVRLRSLDGH